MEHLLTWDSDKKETTWDELMRQGFAAEKYLLKPGLDAEDLEKIAEICSKKSFFKRVAGGEELGKAVFSIFKEISSEFEEKKTINAILTWIDEEHHA